MLVHTTWFTVWLILDFSVERLTFWISLEVIFILIFLFMAANQAEVDRDRREARERAKEMEEIRGIKETLTSLKNDIKEIKQTLKKS